MRKGFLQDYGVLIAFVVLFAINVVTRGGSFLQPQNLLNLVSQNADIGLIAVGMTFVIIAGGIDLSVGSLLALCGAIGLLSLNKTQSMPVALAAAVGVGAFTGFLNGLVISFGRVAPFIVTLAGLAGFRSLAMVAGSGGEIRSQVSAFQNIGFGGLPIPGTADPTGKPLSLYWVAVAFLVVALLAGVLLNRTRFGRHVIAVGSNEQAARYSAIDANRVKVATYVIVGTLAGLAAFFVTARQNSVGTGSTGLYYELDAIAAVVIGGTSLRGGRGRIWGTVVGVLLLTLIANMMTAYRIDPNWQGLVRGMVILIAVLMQRGSKSE
ncbi:MAG: ABC transporter permease [Fimbriimonadales bacterium]